MPDYKVIKEEYIAGGISLEKLAEKHNVSSSSVKRKASKEGWRELRTKAEQKANQKFAEKTGEQNGRKKAKVKDEITGICEKLLEKINDNIDKFTNSPKDVKAISDVLRNLNEIVGEKQRYDINKTKQDIKEQRLKIKKLEKEINEGTTDRTIQIEIVGDGTKNYSQ